MTPTNEELLTVYGACMSSWDADTSYNEDWDENLLNGGSLSYGQCAVTTLVVHDMFSGTFFRGVVSYEEVTTSHYWVVLFDGRKVDFTWDQFPPYATLTDVEMVSRTRLLPNDNKWMNGRYLLLKERVEKLLSSL